MAAAEPARAWWADIEETRTRIERRRAREADEGAEPRWHPREVREVRPGRRLQVVPTFRPDGEAKELLPARRRPRARPLERVGSHPDRVAAWAVGLGAVMLLVAILSAN